MPLLVGVGEALLFGGGEGVGEAFLRGVSVGEGVGVSSGVADGVSDGVGVASGDSSGVAVGEGSGVGTGVGEGVLSGVGVGVGRGELFGRGEVLGRAVGDGVGERLVVVFFFFFGGGGGPVRKSFTLPRNVSSDWAANEELPPKAIAATSAKRKMNFISGFLKLGGKLLQNCLVHPDTGLEVFDREVLVRRMRPAVGKRQPH